MIIEDSIKPIGNITGTIKYLDGRTEVIKFKNSVLRKGREALAASLANNFGNNYSFYISRMVFGDGGTQNGVPKLVNSNKNGLFGLVRANKPVISTLDRNMPSQVIFTSVLDFSEANGYSINEMALVMNNGDFYSLATFPDLGKTQQMEILWSWDLSFI